MLMTTLYEFPIVYFIPSISELRFFTRTLTLSLKPLVKVFNPSRHAPKGCLTREMGQHPTGGTLMSANFLAPRSYSACAMKEERKLVTLANRANIDRLAEEGSSP